MPKQSAVVPEETIVVPAAYPPPRRDSLQRRFLTQIEFSGNRVNSWVDSMRASSPTHRTPASAPLSSAASVVTRDDEYSYWMGQHPSALGSFEEIMELSKGKQIAMFLDYDGTLSPIVQDPDRAFMSDSMRAAVKDVARFFPTAIVSGRCRDKVYNFVKLGELFYAGSHGMDIKGPNKGSKHTKAQARSVLFQPASEFLPMIHEVYNKLVEKTKTTPGAIVENNKFCISVHFRCVDERRWSSLADQVKTVLKEYPKLHLTQGRKGPDLSTSLPSSMEKLGIKVLEIRPSIKWDKGKALEFLLESLGFADCNDLFPIYIGDDRTDEDAFKVLRERGQGLGILVSKSPKETRASYSLQEPAEVMNFLHCLVNLKRGSIKGRSKA